MKKILQLLFISVLLTCSSFAQMLANDKLIMMERIGTDSDGDPLFRIASIQSNLRSFYDRLYTDNGVQRTVSEYQKIQSSVAQANAPAGYHSAIQPMPVFLEVGNNTGTYCEWKGTFSIQDQNGRVSKYDEPRVIVDSNDPMFGAQDRSLVEQTVVHEIGHSMMAKLYGNKNNLPDTPWLGRVHYGDMVTDGELAVIEGWAEFVGAYFTGRNTIAEDPAESISQNAYAYTDQGTPKTPDNLFCTEGWAATMMLHIAKHPSIANGFEKMSEMMRKYKPQNFNDFIRLYMAENPEDANYVRSLLSKNSLNQTSEPLGGTVASNPVATPPLVQTAPLENTPTDASLMNLFNDYQSSLNTWAQLRLDLSNADWYAGAQPQEIQRRLSFQTSLLKSLEAQLFSAFGRTTSNQEIIAMTLLDNMEKVRLEHNRLLQSYEKLSFWDQQARRKIQNELELYRDLHAMNKQMADNMDQQVMLTVWNTRMERLQYMVNYVQQGVAAPSSSAANAPSHEAYNKLVDAIKANRRLDETRQLLQSYSSSSR